MAACLNPDCRWGHARVTWSRTYVLKTGRIRCRGILWCPVCKTRRQITVDDGGETRRKRLDHLSDHEAAEVQPVRPQHSRRPKFGRASDKNPST